MGKLSTLKKNYTQQREIDLARFKIFARLKFCVNNSSNNKNY